MLRGRVPDTDIGGQCGNPYECGFGERCWEHIPEYSVFDPGGSRSTMFELYKGGMVRLEDIPPDALSARQRFVLDAYAARSVLFDREQAGEFPGSLWYPLCFLDFETFSVPVPLFDGARPYQRIPYQYSLRYPAGRESELQHAEFLAMPGADSGKDLVEHLLSRIPKGACVLAYNAPYEARILKELSGWLPGMRPEIPGIAENLRDLAAPFRQRLAYHWEMTGSYSRKAVLPSLVPSMGYDGLEIRNGGMARRLFQDVRPSRPARDSGHPGSALSLLPYGYAGHGRARAQAEKAYLTSWHTLPGPCSREQPTRGARMRHRRPIRNGLRNCTFLPLPADR
jgi:hypothetical protein